MRHQRDLIDLRQGIEPGPGPPERGGREAQPVHAAVEFEKHPVRRLSLVPAEPVDLGLVVDHMPKVQPRTQLQIARLEHPFEQQDRAAPIQRAQQAGLGQVEQGKAVGAAQAGKGMGDAVAIGIGLDHRPQPGVRGVGARLSQVVRQGVGVDQGFDRAGHGWSLQWGVGPAGWRAGGFCQPPFGPRPGGCQQKGVRAITAPHPVPWPRVPPCKLVDAAAPKGSLPFGALEPQTAV